ncbi:cation-transporting ATPase [Mycobacterium vulneris]|uniref:Cation transporter n=1 Tax=Mycolicibacterium porcinum TaxID=39693 RepID=A0AAP7H8T3_9MYCO|nr:cation transporter [Mycolicibacterium porcinum]MBX8688159.1 cation-transporting ATPase [Mycobacterium sp. 20091114027_K0903767]OCB44627.1 cation-transporting ATPase [Mycolicibacterium vulneris]MCV7388556.1 heavy-metal-associated domain-containing protein [Mycolicibacterium porcinum]OCB11723.1 cation-transporting ATPase [Mycolicibacterium porcinum]OCB58082.1 cation-transporting ATPase [Mycolicibacterium vulneris]
MSTQTVTVTGMTCGHCVTSVREEVGGLPGVRTVDVDLATGLVTIDSEGGLDPTAISAAVAEAGYAVAG